MCNEITEADYKKCLEDLIECLHTKFSIPVIDWYTFKICTNQNKEFSVLIHNSYTRCDEFFTSETLNCKTYYELFERFKNVLYDTAPSIEKQFGKTFSEIRINCDLMMN